MAPQVTGCVSNLQVKLKDIFHPSFKTETESTSENAPQTRLKPFIRWKRKVSLSFILYHLFITENPSPTSWVLPKGRMGDA